MIDDNVTRHKGREAHWAMLCALECVEVPEKGLSVDELSEIVDGVWDFVQSSCVDAEQPIPLPPIVLRLLQDEVRSRSDELAARLLYPDDKRLDEKAEELERLGFDLMNDAPEFIGKPFPPSCWTEPEREDVEQFLEETADEPEGRIQEYDAEGQLTAEEQVSFKEWLMEDAYENEYWPGLFVGTLELATQRLCVVVERIGGYNDCEVRLAGVFKDEEQARIRLHCVDD